MSEVTLLPSLCTCTGMSWGDLFLLLLLLLLPLLLDMTRLEAAEMHFLRSVTGYTRLDKVRSEDIRQELEISGIQDVRQTKLDQPLRKIGQHQTPEIHPHLQTPGKKGSRMLQETMATRRCWSKSNDLIHGGR